MLVREIMTRSTELIDANATVRDAAIRMRDDDLGALPVGEGYSLFGMVTDRYITVRAVAADRAGGSTAVREVMSEGLYTCYADDSMEDAARLMAEHKLRRIPVIDHDEKLVGIVALADIARSGGRGAEAAKEALVDVSEATPHAARV